jgi:hypothetical protein
MKQQEALSIAFNRAVQRRFGKKNPVSTLEIKVACGAILVAHLGEISNLEERRESFVEFVLYLADALKLGEITEH